MSKTRGVRVVVAESADAGGRSLTSILKAEGFDVVGRASNHEELESVLGATVPQVIVFDAEMSAQTVLATRDWAPQAGTVVVWPQGVVGSGADQQVEPFRVAEDLPPAVHQAARVYHAPAIPLAVVPLVEEPVPIPEAEPAVAVTSAKRRQRRAAATKPARMPSRRLETVFALAASLVIIVGAVALQSPLEPATETGNSVALAEPPPPFAIAPDHPTVAGTNNPSPGPEGPSGPQNPSNLGLPTPAPTTSPTASPTFVGPVGGSVLVAGGGQTGRAPGGGGPGGGGPGGGGPGGGGPGGPPPEPPGPPPPEPPGPPTPEPPGPGNGHGSNGHHGTGNSGHHGDGNHGNGNGNGGGSGGSPGNSGGHSNAGGNGGGNSNAGGNGGGNGGPSRSSSSSSGSSSSPGNSGSHSNSGNSNGNGQSGESHGNSDH
ncbi:MAG: hypothetical protein WD276_10295 [Actinomycetota bacterium]